ncbi:MAG: hypothetical protein JXR96_07215 [Deltaproteobacteria bacterium]|nr:hypothetical protein [Deltaproteobacteria bacterium]
MRDARGCLVTGIAVLFLLGLGGPSMAQLAPGQSAPNPALEKEARVVGMAVFDSILAVVRIVAEHGKDCDQGLKKAEAYVQANRAELVRKMSRMKALEQELSSDQKDRLEKELESQFQAKMAEVQKTMTEYGQRCPEHMGRLAILLGSLESGEGGASPTTAESPTMEKAPDPVLDAEQKKALDLAMKQFAIFEATIGILAEHRQDCDKAIQKVEAYVKSKLEQVGKLNAELKQFEKKLGPEKWRQVGEKLRGRAEGTMKKSIGHLMEFTQKCPQQAQRFGELMRSFDLK